MSWWTRPASDTQVSHGDRFWLYVLAAIIMLLPRENLKLIRWTALAIIMTGVWQVRADDGRLLYGPGGEGVPHDVDGVHVIAINAGDSGGKKFPRLTAVPYDPKRNFYNFARRFDLELEQKLVAFISRFAHLKNPPQTIKARSELIRKVQSNLNRLGYDVGPVDGFIGEKTRDAIRAFQTSLGITPTGRLSEELLLLLESK